MRHLTLRPQAQHKALQHARQQQQTEVWQEQYAKRAGIEGTISQAVRGFGLREYRYIGLARTHLQHVLTVAAINLTRLDAWFTGKKRAQTRISRTAFIHLILDLPTISMTVQTPSTQHRAFFVYSKRIIGTKQQAAPNNTNEPETELMTGMVCS